MKKARSTSMESRLTRLETDMEYVRGQVENHIPTILAAHGKMLENIERRVGDMDAVSRFLSIVVKGVAAVLGIVWSAKKLFGHP